MKVNKKKYVAPVAEEIMFLTQSGILMISGVSACSEEEAEGDGTDQLGGESRNDWDNIWTDM